MRRTILAVFLTAGLSACVAPGVGMDDDISMTRYDRRSHEAIVRDAEIERNFRDELLRRVELSRPTHIKLHAFNGLALLTGEAPTEQLRDWAVNLARIIPGVQQVHDYISIARVSTEASRQKDASLQRALQKALTKIAPTPRFHPSQIKIVTEQGVVYLLGLVHRNEADAVIKQLRGVGGVKEIVTVFTYTG